MSDLWAEVLAAWEESGREGNPWRAGMRIAGGGRLNVGEHIVPLVEGVPRESFDGLPLSVWLKLGAFACTIDPTDPATLGALDGVLREVTGGLAVVSSGSGWWSVETEYGDWDNDNTGSLFEALCRALIAGLRRGEL
jgi:hypothetical protein